MTGRIASTCRVVLCAAALATAMTAVVPAQGGRGAPQGPPGGRGGPATAEAAAPIDLTGYWVAIVNEDWRWRMVTPPPGDFPGIPLNPAGQKVAQSWDPATDGSCEAFGAAALLRMPTRLHITWEDANTLRIDTDNGEQTRLLRFGDGPAPGTPSLQGHSRAEWLRPGGRGRGGLGPRGGGPPAGGTLQVVTTNLSGGWLRRNGVPYSADATVTEYVDRFPVPDGGEWFAVTTVVEDPTYLRNRFVTSSHFRREPDGSRWSPRACRS